MTDNVRNPEQIQTWIDAARCDSDAACEALYRHFAAGVYRLAYGVLLHKQDAEEVVQDSFAYALGSLDRYDETQSAFKTWLYMITMSRCRNKRRRKWLPTIQLSAAAEWLPGGTVHPEAATLRKGARQRILDALGELSPLQREAIVLRYFEGLTYREMGEILGCPQKTAESRVRLAHNSLYDLLADERDLLMEGLLGHEGAH